MDTLSLRIKYRPLRIGWCLPDGDRVSLRKALRLTHAVWGGRYNPIIPVGDLDRGRELVKVFRVDILIPLAEDDAVKAFIGQFPYLSSPFLDSRLFVESVSGRPSAIVLDLYHPIRRLYEEHFKNNRQSDFRASLYAWDDDDPLADVFLATFGGLPPKEEAGTDYQELIAKYLAAERVTLTGEDIVPSDAFKKATLNWISCVDLQHHYAVINHWGRPGFYAGSAADFHDLVNYWNLRATDADLLFYDRSFSDRLNALRVEYLAALRARPKGSQVFDSHIAIWAQDGNDLSNPPDIPNFTDFGSDVLGHFAGFGIWNGLNVRVPIMHFGEKSVLATVGSSSGSFRVSFALPEKPSFEGSYSFDQHLVASISPGIGLYNDERSTLMTPFLPELNEFYGRNCWFHPFETRVEPEGLGLIIDNWRTDVSLSAMDVPTLLSKIFEVAGIQARPSQAGLIAFRLIQQLGGLLGCGVLKSAGVRKLIEKYKPDQSFTRGAAIQIIREHDSGSSPTLGGRVRPEDMFANLVTRGVFRVGLKLECPRCHLDFWISLDDVRTQTKCEYCGDDFDVTSQLRDRDWRYRRSGLFGRDDHQEGGIPVALTLQQLQSALGHFQILYTTGMELEPASAPVRKCETDFVILTQRNIDHKVEIAIDECKNRGEITEDDVSKLRIVAEALNEKNIQVCVIFVKLADFTPQELERCRAINGQYKQRMILLTPRELEPYFLYERTAQEFDIRRSANSFTDMVAATHAVFYQQRRRSSGIETAT
jgi:hypothetical protein